MVQKVSKSTMRSIKKDVGKTATAFIKKGYSPKQSWSNAWKIAKSRHKEFTSNEEYTTKKVRKKAHY